MNCKDAERLISAERDGMLNDDQRPALEAHVEACSHCRQFRTVLTKAVEAWAIRSRSIPIPDADREVAAIRRRLRQTGSGGMAQSRSNWRPALWFGLPLGAAAAAALVAVAVFFKTGPELGADVRDFAEAEYIEVDEFASVVVFVDEESGWLVVWSVPELGETGT